MTIASLSAAALAAPELAPSCSQTLRDWPWFDTLRTLRLRFREDRLGLTAGSLTFTTLIALVPLFTVMLAVFTAFPMFSSASRARWRTTSCSPWCPTPSRGPCCSALTEFASKATRHRRRRRWCCWA